MLSLGVSASLGTPLDGAPTRTLDAAPAGAHRTMWPSKASRRAVVTDDPLAPEQWYLGRTRALDGWVELPPLAPVLVAVIDSGIDLGHPEFEGRIAAARSFVDGPVLDTKGHGTIVAGIIAAGFDNAIGITGLAPSAQLLVAKVVRNDETISVSAEAKAVRWAVDQGAQVINMSLGGLRDPRNPERDTFSVLESEAVAYAVSKGVLVVASVGNSDQAPSEPWQYASYPAALPHVVGVSAVGEGGNAPAFSNRDTRYNDLAAPGVGILSTFPRKLSRAGCAERGYTLCATERFESPEGTSFAAPQVAAVAANLLAVRPDLTASQLAVLVERTTADAKPSSGCGRCLPGRDSLTGWGELDGAAALAALDEDLPATDVLEPNDDAGGQAYRLYFPPGSPARTVKATLDFWDDRDDVFGVYLRRGQRVFASLTASGAITTLALWSPNTDTVGRQTDRARRLASSAGPGARERITWTATETGWHYIQARVDARVGPVPTVLSISRSK
jgi:subtilisin family serine protease